MDLKKVIGKKVTEQHWTIGIIENPLDEIISGVSFDVKYIKDMPCDRWFADPFILDYDDNSISILAEEYCYKIRRGRIAKLQIDRQSYRLLDYTIILDLSTHLSFPFIQRKENQIFISPENSESGEWTTYKYNIENGSLLFDHVNKGLPLTDAVRTDFFGKELIFSTHIPTQNGKKLTVYNIDGSIKEEITFPSNVARNAGDWFCVNNRFYRPAQDCNGEYGKAVIIQEVIPPKNEESFKFIDVRRIESTNPRFTTGCHTFNTYKGLTVIDVHGWRMPSLMNVIFKFRKLTHL